MPFDTDSDTSGEWEYGEMMENVGPPPSWIEEQIWTHSHIDDGISGKKLYNLASTSHFTTNKEGKTIHASKCENLYKTVRKNAKAIGMKINNTKTQLLCMSVTRNLVEWRPL